MYFVHVYIFKKFQKKKKNQVSQIFPKKKKKKNQIKSNEKVFGLGALGL